MKTSGNIIRSAGFLLAYLFFSGNAYGQDVSFALKTTPNVDFTFNTFEKYENGIILPHALELKVEATGTQWDLYIGTTTVTSGSWNVTSTYSSTGISPPPVSLIQTRVYNGSSTQQTGSGFFALTDIATPTYLIGSIANDASVNCGDAMPTGTNEPGDYLTSPSCYQFNVDLKIVPGFDYRPGLYTVRIDFIIIRDL